MNRFLEEANEVTRTGTTTLGVVAKNGVVMGTEMRATMGHLISHKATQKLFRIDDHLGFTVAGLVGDAQTLARWLQAEVELYKVKRGAPISVKAASTLMANILNSRKFYPFYVQLLVGGWDKDGGHVFSLDAAGGSIPDKFASTGSGSPMVYGVLEDLWREDLALDEAIDIAIRCITAAMKRDSASGDGIALCTITPQKGYQVVEGPELDRRRKKLKLE